MDIKNGDKIVFWLWDLIYKTEPEIKELTYNVRLQYMANTTVNARSLCYNYDIFTCIWENQWISLCQQLYWYDCSGWERPEFRPNDYQALERVVKYIESVLIRKWGWIKIYSETWEMKYETTYSLYTPEKEMTITKESKKIIKSLANGDIIVSKSWLEAVVDLILPDKVLTTTRWGGIKNPERLIFSTDELWIWFDKQSWVVKWNLFKVKLSEIIAKFELDWVEDIKKHIEWFAPGEPQTEMVRGTIISDWMSRNRRVFWEVVWDNNEKWIITSTYTSEPYKLLKKIEPEALFFEASLKETYKILDFALSKKTIAHAFDIWESILEIIDDL